MWTHFLNLLSRSWDEVGVALSTSTLSIVLFTVAAPLVTFAITMVYLYKSSLRGSFMTHVKDAFIPTLIGFAVPVTFLLIVYGWKIVATVYQDHQTLVSKVQLLENQTPSGISATFVSTPVIGIDEENPKNTKLILGLNIINTGEPTALFGFNLQVFLTNGSAFLLTPLNRNVKPLELTFPDGGKAEISPDEYLPKKVGEMPIPHNGRASGYVPYKLEGVGPQEFQQQTIGITIGFLDVNKKMHTVTGQIMPKGNTLESIVTTSP